jgi:hypothetical protein
MRSTGDTIFACGSRLDFPCLGVKLSGRTARVPPGRDAWWKLADWSDGLSPEAPADLDALSAVCDAIDAVALRRGVDFTDGETPVDGAFEGVGISAESVSVAAML